MSTPSNPSPARKVRPTRVTTPVVIDTAAGMPPQPKSVWQWLSSVSASLGVHLLLILVLSWLYFDLPVQMVLDSVLVLVGVGDEQQDDQIEWNQPAAPVNPQELDEHTPTPLIDLNDLPPMAPQSAESDSLPEPDLGAMDGGGTPVARDPAKKPTPDAVPGRPKNARKKGAAGDSTADARGAVAMHGDHFQGRTPLGKRALLKKMGGTDASEAAVARGLVWLKNHQQPNGAWSFYHLTTPECDCTQPGRLADNTNAATAMALLAFLGAGHTHLEGQYQDEVQRGLKYLMTNGVPVERGICFYGQLTGPQTFYTQGLVTIALGEAFAMTGDAQIRQSLTGAVDFLVATQESGGGWRYFPGQPGDTSVVAWQLMGLKSAQFSRIQVPTKVFKGVDRFLNSVVSMRGSQYAYLPDRRELPTYSMTAAGLLCRMYLDWKPDQGGLKAGIRYLDEHGPEPDGMYYNYYATQVMHHWGGPEWERWNPVMRDFLVQTQIQQGHATGSWDVADRHGNMGGRLYMTTLALLTLEVYYRHLPLYQKDRIELPLLTPEAAAKVSEK